jgi:cellobiose epimerase
MTNSLDQLHQQINDEVHRILQWWRLHAPDALHGGFIGEIDQYNVPNHHAAKGSVLNARILWTFSAAYRKFGHAEDLALANRAFDYFITYFYDATYSGVYWKLNANGDVNNDRKQIYAIAFAIYGLSEYYKITADQKALDAAITLYQAIEHYSRDFDLGGYHEAYSRDWTLIGDLRLSDKDRNDPKTMNTHLHIIEAYANLYLIWKEPHLKQTIEDLLDTFEKRILNPSNHLSLFFDTAWNSTSSAISYGHDIEASWLLHECAHNLHDDTIEKKWQAKAILIADAAAEGIQSDGSLIHEYDPEHQHQDPHREWWVSAEGMVGFMNAYLISKDEKYLNKVYLLWDFIKQYLLDHKHGEWYWGVHTDYTKMDMYTMGFWKCPYHNVRACLEVMERIEKMHFGGIH